MPTNAAHGTRTRYRYRRDPCHCTPCRAANAAWGREHRRRHAHQRWAAQHNTPRVSYIGIQRRARALAYLGYPLAEQARRVGIPHRTYTRITRPGVETQTWPAAKAARLFDLYDRLAYAPLPTGWAADQCRRRARARGWHAPAVWDDDTIDDPAAAPAGLPAPARRRRRTVDTRVEDPEADLIAVDMVIAGERPWSQLNRADRLALVARLLARGWPPSRIAHRFGLSGSTITALVEQIRPTTGAREAA